MSHRGLAVRGQVSNLQLGDTATVHVAGTAADEPVRLACLVVHRTSDGPEECVIGFEIDKADPAFIEKVYYPLYREFLQELAAESGPA